MDRFSGIKKAKVKLKRNTYKNYKRGGALWRYVAAAIIVVVVSFINIYTDFDVAEYFKQDYIEQYAQD